MVIIGRLIDFFTLGSERPMRRLVAYYVVVAVVIGVIMYFFPVVDRLLFSGERLEELTRGTQVLQEGLTTHQFQLPEIGLPPRLELVITTTLILIGTLVLMLPASWVYMSVQRSKGINQSFVQTLIILPMVVAGIILIVRNSLALAFSLAGVVAGVRFRTTLTDSREITFVFLAIAVGFAAGVQVMTVAALLSVIFNVVLLLIWRYDFGRNVLEPTAASQWAEPLGELATQKAGEKVPDRDLVVALTPKNVAALEERFDRVRGLVGAGGKKPQYNSVLAITSHDVTAAQRQVEPVLDEMVKRWKLDEVVNNDGKPSELYYLLRLKKSTTEDELVTAIRGAAGDAVESVDVELGAALTKDDG
jgi:uncharacterized protein DUF4956